MQLIAFNAFALFYLVVIDAAKILGIFPSVGYSQFILGGKLMTELVKRGHNVTVMSPYEPKEKIDNYRSILIDNIGEVSEGTLYDWLENNALSNDIEFHNFCSKLTEYLLSNEKVQKLIHSNETFDLAIVEQFGNEAHMGFASHFNATLVTFSSIGLSEWNSHLVGNIKLPSILPFSLSYMTSHMSFYQRVGNTVFHVFDMIYKELVHFPRQQSYLDKYFPRKIDLKEIMSSTSLMLMNSHVATTEPAQLTSSMVEIGGFHITSKKLPPHLQKFLDEADHGAIFFSMGSNLNSTDFSQQTLNAILSVFSKLHERIIWKFEEDNIPYKLKNVMISKWLPQNDILAHPKTIAFITHGGLLSTTEAIFHGVPMICIPIFGDQPMNAAKSVRKGIAVYLPFQNISEESFYTAIRYVIDSPEIKAKAKKYSAIFRDRPIDPLDSAIFWIEYVLRHKGASFLRNTSMDLYWFQLYLLDVWLFILSCLALPYLLLRRHVIK